MSDFTNEAEVSVQMSTFELDSGVDFVAVGDFSTIVVPGTGWGEGGWGEGPWGGTDEVVIISSPITEWTNIDTP